VNRAVALLVVSLATTACSGVSSQPETDLPAATRVLEVPIESFAVIGKDAEAFVADTPGDEEERLDRMSVALAEAVVVDVFEGAAPPEERIVFVRDPLSKGSIDEFLIGIETVVVVLRPLLDPTRRGAQFDAWLIGLDSSGSMLRSDWEGDGEGRIGALMEWAAESGIGPAEAVAWAARGLAGVSRDPLAEEAASIIG
jgi:hypothetical protein